MRSMSTHRARIEWARSTPDFAYESYDRGHTVAYESGARVAASSAPDYLGDAAKMNPEEALVGALSSCHMLTFLAICAKKKLTVDRYDDDAWGELGKGDEGRMAITKVVLTPRVTFAPGVTVDGEALAKLHDTAHRNCFIANTVKCPVTVE